MTSAAELFPESPRFIYQEAPLTSVICQLRFPPILRIESDPPADFQDRIRAIFPLLERRQSINLAQGLPPELAQLIGQAAGANYMFRTEDRKFTLTLAPESLSLSTTNYERWEGFRNFLKPPLEALIKIYKPAFFSRIGLRYQNAINRTKLGFGENPWMDLLIAPILGALTDPKFEANMVEVRKIARARFPDGAGTILLQHGFGGENGRDRAIYLLDFDLSTEKTEVQNAITILDDFHVRAGRAFRWCLTPLLHERLGPKPVDAPSERPRAGHRRSRNVR